MMRWAVGLAISIALSSAPLSAQTPPPAPTDLLITGVTLTDVEGMRFVPDQTIAVRGNTIAYIGPATAEWSQGKRIIDGKSFIALPGFVNTHTHLWQHAARGIAPTLKLQEWASAVYKLSHHALPGEVYAVTRAAVAQGLLNGVTSVSDFASINFTDTATAETVAALKDLHVGGAVIWWRPAVFLPWQLQDRQLAALSALGGSQLSISVGIGPLSFMPVPVVYDGVRTAQRNHLRMSEHAMENLQEARDFRDAVTRYLAATKLAIEDRALLERAIAGPEMPSVDAVIAMSRTRDALLADPLWSKELSPTVRQALGALPAYSTPSQLALLDAWGALGGFLSIHSVWPSAADIAIYRARGAAVSHNPESNMYLSSGVAPLQQYRDASVPVTLGTDGAASNDRINMFDAMRTAWLLQKVATLQPEVTAPLDGWFFLRAATINGALSLGIGERTGSLKAGKEADILLLDTETLSLAPADLSTAASRLVTSAEPRDLAFVIADGSIAVERGKLIGIDEALLARDLTRIARAFSDRETRGKPWSGEIVLDGTVPLPAQYRLIRRPDTVDLQIVNRQSRPARMTVAFSCTTFGGRTPLTMHPETLSRYPASAQKDSSIHELVLRPGETVTIRKAASAAEYAVSGKTAFTRACAQQQEQVAIYGL